MNLSDRPFRGNLDWPLTINKDERGVIKVSCPLIKGHSWTGKDDFEARQNAKAGILKLNGERALDIRPEWQRTSEWVKDAPPAGSEIKPAWMSEPEFVGKPDTD